MDSSLLDGRLAPTVPLASSDQSLDLRDSHSSSFRESLSPRASIPPARPTPSRTTEPFPGLDFRRNRPSPFHEILSPRASIPPARPTSFLDTETPPVSSPLQPQPWDLSQPPSAMLPPATAPASNYSQSPLANDSPPQLGRFQSQPSPRPEPFRPPRFAPAVIALLETLNPLSSQVPNTQMLRLVDQVGRAFFNEC